MAGHFNFHFAAAPSRDRGENAEADANLEDGFKPLGREKGSTGTRLGRGLAAVSAAVMGRVRSARSADGSAKLSEEVR